MSDESAASHEASAARLAASLAYCPHFGEVLAGCALRTRSGAVFWGASLGTWAGLGAVSPLAMALVSLSAQGGGPSDIAGATWATAGASTPEADHLKTEDAELLRFIAPGIELAAATP